MSEAMNDVYRSGQSEFPQEVTDLLFPIARPKSVEERSRQAVERIFEAVDKARQQAPKDGNSN